MEFNDYTEQLEYTDLSIDVESWHHVGFAVLNDDAPFNRDTVFDGDSTEYNLHKLLLKSPVKQKTIVTMYLYHWKHYHGQCGKQFELSETEVLL